VSEAIADQFSDRRKVCVINNGFDIGEFVLAEAGQGAAFRESYALGAGLVVGCVGRIKLVRKGQEVLLRAAAILKKRGVSAKYVIVGAPFPGNEAHIEALREIVSESGLEGDVVFAGEVADPRPAYAAMDVFVLPSAQPEPFGGVVMEAMGMGLPVIATNIGGSVEQVADGETGFLVGPSDPEALAEKLEPLLRDAAMRARMGAAGRQRIAEHFTVGGMVEKIVRVYDECIGVAAQRPARILFVNNSADIYGASRCLVRLIERLDPQRFEAVVVLPERGPLDPLLARTRAKVIFFPQVSVITRGVFRSWRLPLFLLNLPLAIFAMWRLVRRERIDLVHTNAGVVLSAGPAAWLAGVPSVWHIRDWFQEFSTFWALYSHYIRAFSDRILAVSGPIAAQFPAAFGVTVVHDGFELAEFALDDPEAGAKFRAAWNLGTHPVIGCVGRIKLIRKGQEFLLRAAAILKGRGVSAKYLIVGAPFPGNESHVEVLRGIVREAGLDEDVIFTGEIPDAHPAYAAMNVFALPSAQPEPFGGVVMEAMGMGLPVVATRIGGSIEQVADGESGFLVSPGDPAALAEKIEILLRDPALCARMGAAGRRRIEELFTLNGMVENIVRVYEECLTKR
jgi:glycosyltransferase involved in cell wall biosynthesis